MSKHTHAGCSGCAVCGWRGIGMTVWCDECEGPSDVEVDSMETDAHQIDWWVRRLDCGHEQTERR